MQYTYKLYTSYTQSMVFIKMIPRFYTFATF